MKRPPSLHDVRAGLRRRSNDPIFWNDTVQLFKTVAAAVIAWVVATSVLDLPQPFLAPWAALLVVHATVYRTFSQGARQVAATGLGVVLAWAVGGALGLDTVSVAVALVVGLVIGAVTWFEDQETTIAATALVVLTTGFSQNDSMLVSRLLDTGIGIGVGLLVNAVVWPPLRRRTAVTAIDKVDDRIGRLLTRVHDDLRRHPGTPLQQETVAEWVEETRALDGDLDNAWSLVRQAQESARMNPRRSARQVRQPQQWFSLLHRMEQAVAEQRSMARTLGRSLERGEEWHETFRDGWLRLLEEAGRAVQDADSEALVDVRGRIDDLARDLEQLDPLPLLWPEYGALLFNLRNVVDTMDEVAAANPLGQPPLPVRLPAPVLRRDGTAVGSVPADGLTNEDRAGLDAPSASGSGSR
ncbi:hypothetical protein G7072_02470 [Nocardioides sp. HDW12B]|uniref:FUSC family protein n=1 Tax=Nocardioides sp. HDW12B TaxID=2714939 RepID=UPI00140A6E90|nr:FUSC family protein [Nocardioides sp. HDW12B]QIK65353.1 hypothetical protein G7072_02470 [Nocardioides sp. HDW12B]